MSAAWGGTSVERKEEWRQQYLNVERSAAQQRKDLVVAFDRIHKLEAKLQSCSLKLWVVLGAAAAEGAIIGWMATALLNCLAQAQIVR